MRPKLTLYRKGLIVIALPLLIQIVFFAYYARLLTQSETLADQEFHEKEVIGRANWICTLLTASAFSSALYTITSDKRFLKIANLSDQAIPIEIPELARLLKLDQQQASTLRQSEILIDKLTSIFAKSTKLLPAQGRQEISGQTEDIYSSFSQLYFLRSQILRKEIKSYKMNAESVPLRESQRQLILVGVILDIVIALGLLYAYSYGITRRLTILTDNTRRLAQHQELHKALSGEDEVANLDTVFHDMAHALAAAERQKQEFLSMISHDLRTPLNSVTGSLQLVTLGRCGDISADAMQTLERAERNVETVLRLINELLEIERIEAGGIQLEWSEFEATELFSRAFDLVRSSAEQMNILIMRPQTDARICGDQDRLVRVLVNLLGNAIKFSPPESTIEMRLLEETEWFEIRVIDQGRGIPVQFKEKIFDRFQQVEGTDASEKGGSGLGLSICKVIVDQHGGKIGVQSDENCGSTFWFRIPKFCRLPSSPA